MINRNSIKSIFEKIKDEKEIQNIISKYNEIEKVKESASKSLKAFVVYFFIIY